MDEKFKYIYGPVYSWRLGNSLGIDPISCKDKVCTFDCVYCQVGPTKCFTDERRIFVPTKEIIKEIKRLPDIDIDYITFSGRGEPTLAKNLGELITEIRKVRKEKIAVITNASLITRHDVQDDLVLSNTVLVKLDAPIKEIFIKVNKPHESILFDKILYGIKEFRSFYKGKLGLQIMFMPENKIFAQDIAKMAKDISPDEVEINTPLRESKAEALTKEEIEGIKKYFNGLNVISVYDIPKKQIEPINREDTLKRRAK